MARDKLTEYSATASENTVCGDVNIAENSALPSDLNNYAREIMSHLKEFSDGTNGIDVLALEDDDASASIKFQAPSAVTATVTFTLPDGDGSSGQTLVTNGSGTLAWAAPYGNRNLIINGAMQVAQRGTSVTGITSGAYRTCDRMLFSVTSAGTWTATQSTDSPDGFSNSFRIDCTTAKASLDASNFLILETKIEGQNVQHLMYGDSSAKTVTASFYVKSNKTGTYVLEMRQPDSGRLYNKAYTIDVANTWEYKTLTFPGDVSGTINNDNGEGLNMDFWLAAGSTFTSGSLGTSWHNTNANRAAGQVNLADSTDNDWSITGIQLEVGEQATPFEHRSFGDELRRCQRYFQTLRGQDRYPGDVGHPEVVFGSANLLQTPMRAQPSLSVSGALSFDEYYVSGRTQSSSHIARNSGNTQCVIASFSNFSSMTRGNPGAIYNANIDIDAEL